MKYGFVKLLWFQVFTIFGYVFHSGFLKVIIISIVALSQCLKNWLLWRNHNFSVLYFALLTSRNFRISRKSHRKVQEKNKVTLDICLFWWDFMVYILRVFLVIDCPLRLDTMTIQSYIKLSDASVPFLYILKTFAGDIEIEP